MARATCGAGLFHVAARRSSASAEVDAADVNMMVLNAARLPDPDSVHPDFVAHKAGVLERTLKNDKSPKGCVDARMVPLLLELNQHPEFVTVSSCSGRVLFMAYAAGPDSNAADDEVILPDKSTKVGRWRRVSHDGINDPESYFDLKTEPLNEYSDNLWLKFQPFSLDVSCASPADATRLVTLANSVYHRGASVIAPRREWRTVVNIEDKERLEMPFTIKGKMVYSGSLASLAQIINGKCARNWANMDRLLEVFRNRL